MYISKKTTTCSFLKKVYFLSRLSLTLLQFQYGYHEHMIMGCGSSSRLALDNGRGVMSPAAIMVVNLLWGHYCIFLFSLL